MRLNANWPLWLSSILFLLTPAILHAQCDEYLPTINMDQEPHHHLALQNDYVKVFNVEVAPGETIVMHNHDKDTIAIAIGDQLVTVAVPGKPTAQQKNSDAQVRLQPSGYRHSTKIDGNAPYHTVAVELMRPQTNFHNLCAEVLAGQPLNCAAGSSGDSVRKTNEPLIASDQVTVGMLRLASHESLNPAMNAGASSSAAILIVALDNVTVASSPKAPGKDLKPGEFVWFEGGAADQIQNRSNKDARLIAINLQRAQ